MKSDIPSLVLFRFSEDGNYLAATASNDHSLRVWNIETGVNVVSLNERVRAVTFAAGGRVLVVAIEQGNDHEIGFHDLDHPGQAPRRVPGKGYATSLAVSPDGRYSSVERYRRPESHRMVAQPRRQGGNRTRGHTRRTETSRHDEQT